ncbi:hypothetical protein electrica_02778 [Klebsiella electrica]|uniref:hypothetical protein n=1 Tax=Klebsiella electrica TaxID=1259973 RepID=UPI001154099B|nr:hypothetical protein [Klebsiella electrica]QDI08883.1 hypothetical protein electrica_02778 [Klebsiella electrica]
MSKYIAFSIYALTLISGCSAPSIKSGYVAQQWAINTRQLGIHPIYPLSENYSVGDIYLVPVGDDRTINNLPSESYNVTMKLITNIPVNENEMANKNGFSRTPDFQDSNGVTHKPGLFIEKVVNGKRVNSVCAFPGFSFAAAVGVSGGLEAAYDNAGVAAGGSKKSLYTVSYTVPDAECESISFMNGIAHLYEFKNSKYLPDLKNEGDLLDARLRSLESGRESSGGMSAGVVLATDVYYTRSLDITISAENDAAASASATFANITNISKQRADLIDQLTKLKGPDVNQTTSVTQQQQSLQTQIDSKQKEIDQMSKTLIPSGFPLAASGSVASVSSNGITLKQSYAYPVAIGYNGIARKLSEFLAFVPSPPGENIQKPVVPRDKKRSVLTSSVQGQH